MYDKEKEIIIEIYVILLVIKFLLFLYSANLFIMYSIIFKSIHVYRDYMRRKKNNKNYSRKSVVIFVI